MRGSRPLRKQSDGFKNGGEVRFERAGIANGRAGFPADKAVEREPLLPLCLRCTDHLWSNIHNVLTGRRLHTSTFHGTLERL